MNGEAILSCATEERRNEVRVQADFLAQLATLQGLRQPIGLCAGSQPDRTHIWQTSQTILGD